ncbi:MAG: fumarylacetoacetate hydrolase family protein [Alphaproteobacteria bacterium]
MKICRYESNRVGIVQGEDVYDVTDLQNEIINAQHVDDWSDDAVAALPEFLERAPQVLPGCRTRPLRDVKLLSPVKRPGKLVAAPTNYGAHIAEMRAAFANSNMHRQDIGEAGMFLKASSSMVGASEGIRLRFPHRRNDHEVELAIIIGKKANMVPAEKALEYVAGYCIGLDITLRGAEERSFRKSIDSYSVLGPWMVTADEIPNPNELALRISVNGELRQNANTNDMIFPIERLIEFSSQFYTLFPGDVIFTGTPEGVSPIKAGDTLVAEIEKIGRMETTVRNA